MGTAPSDTTVRRTLELADPATLDKIARARAAVRARVWQLVCSAPGGFPWLAITGKLLAGWLVIDLDATLITARRQGRGRPDVQVRVCYRIWHLPARLVHHARQRILKISPDWSVEGRVPGLLAAVVHPPCTRLTSTNYPVNAKGGPSGAVGAGAHPGTPGSIAHPPTETKKTPAPKLGASTIGNRATGALNY